MQAAEETREQWLMIELTIDDMVQLLRGEPLPKNIGKNYITLVFTDDFLKT